MIISLWIASNYSFFLYFRFWIPLWISSSIIRWNIIVLLLNRSLWLWDIFNFHISLTSKFGLTSKCWIIFFFGNGLGRLNSSLSCKITIIRSRLSLDFNPESPFVIIINICLNSLACYWGWDCNSLYLNFKCFLFTI